MGATVDRDPRVVELFAPEVGFELLFEGRQV
jgi:hypothetical protein